MKSYTAKYFVYALLGAIASLGLFGCGGHGTNDKTVTVAVTSAVSTGIGYVNKLMIRLEIRDEATNAFIVGRQFASGDYLIDSTGVINTGAPKVIVTIHKGEKLVGVMGCDDAGPSPHTVAKQSQSVELGGFNAIAPSTQFTVKDINAATGDYIASTFTVDPQS